MRIATSTELALRPDTRPRGAVVTLTHGAAAMRPDGHEAATRAEIARRLARLAGFEFAGEYSPSNRYAAPLFFVPSDTLTSGCAAEAGITGERDLFGGAVPHRFVATKTITHPLVDPAAHAPPGWCAAFPERVAGVVLEGFSAFALDDALRAGRKVLERGPARVKCASGIAGLGQFVAEDATELGRVLDAVDPAEWEGPGVVVEQNLTDVTTYSVGQVRVAGSVCTYCGTQALTTDNRGREVYGGSQLTVARGGYDALLAVQGAEDVRRAVMLAHAYDRAADRCYRFFASRRNYDVVRGRDARGRVRFGVLEQSWRLGGASGAEIGALEDFRADPSLRVVRAYTREVYGEPPEAPAGATTYFSGRDPHVGRLTKIAWTEAHADAR